jgi:hypothetical protein
MNPEKLYQIHFNDMKQIFESNRYFTFFDFVISHGQLLLRSQKSGDSGSNIDIVFSGTTYIQAFSRLYGLQISLIDTNIDTIHYETVKKYLEFDNNYLFEIESNTEKFFIAASFVSVFENQLDFSESSLNIPGKSRGKEIATSIII